jgi:glucose-fructose oxidoreductase
MIAAAEGGGGRLAVNWPLAWSPSHNTAKRLLDEGAIGPLLEVHHYGGNRGPLYHLAEKVEVTPEEVERQKPHSWWYKPQAGGGSLLDYLGYGATLGTWFMNGEAPLEVTCATWAGPGIAVDEHAIVALRYERGLSKMETRWGTFSDPWTQQPQPKCGFVLVGESGTISSYDYDAVEYVLGCLDRNEPISGCLDPALGLTAQRIVDSAALSAREKRTVELVP